MPTITDLRRWRNGEVFNARDYVYERDLIVSELNRLSGLLTGDTNLNVNNLNVAGTLTVNGQDLDDIVRGQAVYTSLEEPTDQQLDDLWFDRN